ncbi:hypothetical protein lerEdw1_013110 [Lerista edwardsae]|nr:hypothetical protein lerEdw1_013110 [Lerista edwardsae]
MRFLYKGGNPTLAQQWRPITVSNVVYRVLVRVLNGRLVAAALRLLHEAQMNVVPGQWMSGSLVLMHEVFLTVARGQWRGLQVQIDQSKPFDRVDRSYLWAGQGGVGDLPVAPAPPVRACHSNSRRPGLAQGGDARCVGPVAGLPTQPPPVRPGAGPPAQCDPGGRADCRPCHPQWAIAHANDMYILLGDEGELRALGQLLAEYGRALGAAVNVEKFKCYVLGPSSPDILSGPGGGRAGAGGRLRPPTSASNRWPGSRTGGRGQSMRRPGCGRGRGGG